MDSVVARRTKYRGEGVNEYLQQNLAEKMQKKSSLVAGENSTFLIISRCTPLHIPLVKRLLDGLSRPLPVFAPPSGERKKTNNQYDLYYLESRFAKIVGQCHSPE
jgi:hypothetical protein